MKPTDDHLHQLLGRLQLTTLRDQLDTLLDEAARRELNLREALTFFCQAEVARREQRRLEMAARLAKFPFVRTLEDFDFAAQPALDPKPFRDLALCRWVANGDGVLLLGPPGSERRIWRSPWGAPPSSRAIPSCSPPPPPWSPAWPTPTAKGGWTTASATGPNPSC